jgi:hypothetical protein
MWHRSAPTQPRPVSGQFSLTLSRSPLSVTKPRGVSERVHQRPTSVRSCGTGMPATDVGGKGVLSVFDVLRDELLVGILGGGD